MIIWINGAFGSGKSTTAELLHSKIEFSHIYDPEQVGYFLWDSFPTEMKEKGDFQDLEIWRSINYQIIGALIEEGVKIYHFILNADKEDIRHRLITRGECENSWAEQQIDRCLQAFKSNINGEKINTNNLNVEQVVNIIMKKIIYPDLQN